jgi:hypothetical protein
MLRRLSVILAMLTFVLFGGSAFAANPFAGFWVGDWNGGGQRGRIYATISGAGTVAGCVINSGAGDWGDLGGTVSNAGVAAFTVSYTKLTAQTWNGKCSLLNGTIRMSVIVPSTGSRITSTLRRDPFNFAEQAPENSVGEWSGVWQSGRQSGTLQFTVNPNGSVNGVILGNGASGNLTGSVTPQGDFFGSITYPGNIVEPIVSRFVPSGLRLSAPFTQRKNGTTPTRGSLTLKSGPLPDLGSSTRVIGRWAGNWRTATESGAIEVIFLANGSISGTFRKTGSPLIGLINGQATGIGSFQANVTFPVPGQSPMLKSLNGTVSAAGSRLIGGFTLDGVSGSLTLQRR